MLNGNGNAQNTTRTIRVGDFHVAVTATCERGIPLVSDGTWDEPHALDTTQGFLVADEEHIERCGCSGRVLQ